MQKTKTGTFNFSVAWYENLTTGYDSMAEVSTREMAEYNHWLGSAITLSTQQGPPDFCPAGLPINAPTKLARYTLQRVAWISPQLRTSSDHSFIVGVP
jgi:hypothetical protein